MDSFCLDSLGFIIFEITRISYIVNILLYILSSFPHANKMHKIHTIYTLFSLNIMFHYLFSYSQNVIFSGESCLMLFLYPTWCLSIVLEHRRISINGYWSTEDFPSRPLISMTWNLLQIIGRNKFHLTTYILKSGSWLGYSVFNYHVHKHQLQRYNYFSYWT